MAHHAHNFLKHIKIWGLLFFSIAAFISYIKFKNYFTFSIFKQYHQLLYEQTQQHYFEAVVGFMCTYILVVTFSLPGALLLSLLGGYLFGPIGILYVVISATIGATFLFFIVRTSLGEWLASNAKGWLSALEKGFQKNAFNYLLFLRFVPLFPFWVVNIAAGLLNVRPQIFVIATFIGIIPGAIVYVMLGNSLTVFFSSNQSPNLNIIFTPPILLPLLGLALLALLPVFYGYLKKRK